MINVSVENQVKPTEGKIKIAGIAKTWIAAINPNKTELEKLLGAEIEKEPEYFKPNTPIKVNGQETSETKKQLEFRFVLGVEVNKDNCVGYEPSTDKEGNEVESEIFYINNRIYVSDQERDQSQSGKFEFVNAHGQSRWLDKEAFENKEGNDYFAWNNVKRARQGEADLYTFLKTWLRVDSRDVKVGLYFEGEDLYDPSRSTSAVNQLKSLISSSDPLVTEYTEKTNPATGLVEKSAKPKCFYGLSGVNNRGYQEWFKTFSISNPINPAGVVNKSNRMIVDALKEQYGFEAAFPADFKLAVFTEDMVTSPEADGGSSEDDYSSADASTKWGD